MKKNYTTRLEAELIKRIKIEAAENETSECAIIELALRQYFAG